MVPCGILLLAAILGMLGYLVVTGIGSGGSPREHNDIGMSKATAEKTTAPQSPLATADRETPALPVIGATEDIPDTVPPEHPDVDTIPASPETYVDPAPESVSSPVARSLKAPPEPISPAPEPVNSPAIPVRPDFKLSGIAFQEKQDDRMAILNGLPVMTGTMVGGARVEEILRDRVRLSFRDQHFEVHLRKQDPAR